MRTKPLMTIPAGGRRRGRGPLHGLLPKVIALLLVFGLIYVGQIGFAAWRADYPLVAPPAGVDAILGAYHVHTTASDGRGTPEEIAGAARAAGLQFVIVTDHNPKELPPPRYQDGVLLIFGAELSTPHGHVVALGTSRALTLEERENDPVGNVERLGGWTVLAHPVQQKQPWTDWDAAQRARGLELYSADSMFRDAQRHPFTAFLPAAIAWAVDAEHGLLMLVREEKESKDRLLSLAASRDAVALCSHDAHGLPAYEDAFRSMAIYLPQQAGTPGLPADPAEAARRVLTDLSSGRAWCGFRSIASGAGFALSGLSAGARTATAGDTIRVQLPAAAPAEIALRVHGPATVTDDGRSVRLDGEGAVQIEVWARVPRMQYQDGWKPWLVPSPVRVLSRGATSSSDGAP